MGLKVAQAALKSTTNTVGGFRGRLLRPKKILPRTLKVDLPLMKNILTTLTTSALVPLGLTTAASAANDNYRIKNSNTNNINRKNERHYENS